MRFMKVLCCIAFVTALLLTPAMANEAVSTINFKTEALYGNIEGRAARSLAASATFPVEMDYLMQNYGIQIDGLAGEIHPDEIRGTGLHAFWRDSTMGLAGLTASYVEVDRMAANRIGVEGEYYLDDRLTLYGSIGHQDGDVDNSGYGGLKAQYYVQEDLALSASANTSDGFERYAIGAEYQTPVNGLTCFASIGTGEDSYEFAFFGICYYFGGEDKTLIRRHRWDDPPNDLMGSILDTFKVYNSVPATVPVILNHR